MNFDFSSEQKLLRDQARSYLTDKSTSNEVRRILDGHETHHPVLWQGIISLGWLRAQVPEQYGGLGLGSAELCVLAEEIGRALTPIPFSSTAYLFNDIILRSASETQKQTLLSKVSAEGLIGTLAVSEQPGEVTPHRIDTLFKDGCLSGSKIPVVDGGSADYMIVAARRTVGVDLFLVSTGQVGMRSKSIASIDPSRNVAHVTFHNTPAEEITKDGRGWAVLEAVYDSAAIFFAFEQLGGATKALESACDYAKTRYAFGRPIGSFQSIKHRLADLYVNIELARANCYYGAWALSEGGQELSLAAPAARLSATQAYEDCARENIQVHGGMGFTWEVDCHLHYRRSKFLALAIGAQRIWQDKLVTRLDSRNCKV